MNATYVIDRNGWKTLINSEQIIYANFYPACQVTDEDHPDNPKPIDFPAKLEIVLNELIPHTDEGYDGRYLGTTNKSKSILLKGDQAEMLWEAMTREAYVIN